MQCERCNERPATVHLTEITNGQKQETHLCEVCAKEIQLQGFGLLPQMNLHNFLAGLLNYANSSAVKAQNPVVVFL